VLGTVTAGVALLVAMVAVELHTAEPIVALRLLSNRLFRSSTGVLTLASIGFLGTLYAISLYYQDGRGLTALGSGLSTFPEAIGAAHLVAGHEVANLTAYRITFLVAAAFCLAGIASALTIHDADAAATIPSRRYHPHWPAHAIARVWHHPAARPDDRAAA
jgi:hypothetical protein